LPVPPRKPLGQAGSLSYDGCMPRFVVLRHEMPPAEKRGSHFDLMLEHGEVLWTWTCDQLPSAALPVSAQRLADHRLAYLDYEGEVSGDRGSVTRVDEGQYELLAESTEQIRVRVAGQMLRGTLVIAKAAGEVQRWRISLDGE
jgi:hypothetical protein